MISLVSDDPPSPENNLRIRKYKGVEINPEAVKALLKIVSSGLYQNIFSTSVRKSSKMWEKIYEDIQSRGFEITGATKREKITRLFQKWRNMKKAFVRYQIAKFKKTDIKKPMFYELMFQIISKDVLNSQNSDSNSDEETRMDDWDDESDSENPPDIFETNQMDHDYSNSNEADETNSLEQPSHKDTVQSNSPNTVTNHSEPSLEPKPSTSKSSKSFEVLNQIKSFHSASLAQQQQHFTKVVSLLEKQIAQQNTLTAIFSEFLMSQTKSNSNTATAVEREALL